MALSSSRHAFADELEAAHHGHQQVVEIVRDAAGELADRFHLLGLEELLAGTLELDPTGLEGLFGAAALAEIARDLGVSRGSRRPDRRSDR